MFFNKYLLGQNSSIALGYIIVNSYSHRLPALGIKYILYTTTRYKLYINKDYRYKRVESLPQTE